MFRNDLRSAKDVVVQEEHNISACDEDTRVDGRGLTFVRLGKHAQAGMVLKALEHLQRSVG